MSGVRCLLSGVVCCLWLIQIHAEDWPMARGNLQMTGVSDSKLPDKPELLWEFKTGEQIKGSPVIVNGVVYFGGGDRKIYALKLSDGSKLWEFEALDRIESTPCVHEGVLYVGSNDCLLYAIDIATGKKKWTFKTEENVKAPPVVVNGKVLVGSWDMKLYAIDPATGKELWHVETENYVNAACGVSGNKVVFGGCDGYLYVVDSAKGKLLGRVPAGPTVDGKMTDSAYIAASAAIRGNLAYLAHYGEEVVVIDVDALTVKWRFKNSRSFPFMSAPALREDRLVIGGEDKYLHCLNVADGKQIWEFMARGKINSSPVICGDKIVFGSQDRRVHMVSLGSGKELWNYEVGKGVDSSAAVADGKFVIGCDDGTLYAFGAKK